MKRLIERIKGFDPKRMIKMINVVCVRSRRSFLNVFLDIFRCFIKYGSGYMDYYLFYFETLTDEEKSTYITQAVNKDYIRHCNNPNYYSIFNNKNKFIEVYKKFIKRDTLDLTKASFEEFCLFTQKHNEFMAKPIDGLCGYGVELIEMKNENPSSLYERLNKNGQLLLEERIVQCKEINRIYDQSINTIRIVTLNKDDKVSILFRAMRIGNGGKHVDNFNNGGLMAVIEEDGTIIKPALDKENHVYLSHPMTYTSIVNFSVPRFNEIIELCTSLARVTPQIGIVGWDIAVTEDGLDVVEGNQIPGYDIYQSREQLLPSRLGIKKRFDDAIYPERIDKEIFAKGYNYTKLIWAFCLGVIVNVLCSFININLPIAFCIFASYILLYRRIDVRPFRFTLLYIALIGFGIFLFDFLLFSNFGPAFMPSHDLINRISDYYLSCAVLFIRDVLETFALCLLNLYFILPFVDKVAESFEPSRGKCISIVLLAIDLVAIISVVFTFVAGLVIIL